MIFKNNVVALKSQVFYFSMGVVTGVLSWKYGNSLLPSALLKFFSGLGCLCLIFVMASVTLLSISCITKKAPGWLTCAITRRSLKGCAKVTIFFSGASLISLICAVQIQNGNAIKFTIYGTFFVAIFSYFYRSTRFLLNRANYQSAYSTETSR